jgi:Tfp pilus assembly PilM family ATPase
MATRVFAVDLGAWSVKLAIASPGLRGATQLAVHERLVPPGDESDDVRARRVLAGLIEELHLDHETGYIGVYGDQVFTQVLEFGFKNLRRAELDKAVGGELEGVVPVDLEDMVYTFEALPQPPATGPQPETRGRIAAPSEGMRVLTYAMRRQRAEELIALGKECGFEPRGVLAAGGSAVRLVERTPSLVTARQDGAVAVIDIGHERTDVVVVAQGKAIFSRSIARAGKQVTAAIAKHWTLPWHDAERAKHSDGFVASQAEPATSPQWMKIHEVVVTELHPFARDLRQTLAACRAKTGFTVTAVLAVGGGSRLRGMASFLGEQLGTPCWRPSTDDITALAGPRLATEAPTLSIDSAAMTVGMAYDAAGGRPMFDLRSGALAVKMDLSFLRSKAIPIGTAVLFIAAFAAGSAYADLYRLKKAESTLSTRFAAEREEIPQFKGKNVAPEDIVDTNTGGPGGVRGGSPLPKLSAYDILIDISSKVPPKDKISLDVDKLDITEKSVELSGTVKTAEEIDALEKALKDIKCFGDIKRGATETEGELKKFKLTIASTCM